jgi:8-oxo-dGTP pyrophosphatase MutT (NUDIX family)
MDPVTPRPAATIAVIRDENSVLEILMLRRSSQLAAAPGAYVFPGGVVESSDHEIVRRELVVGLSEVDAARRLGVKQGALVFYCAALRELFEEVGVLVSVDEYGGEVDVTAQEVATWREELVNGRVSWPELLEREGRRLTLEGVQYLAHWITPETRPRRFDTRFFVVRARGQQGIVPDGHEVLEHVWTSATEALRRHASGDWEMLLPTRSVLQVLSTMKSVDDVLTYAATTTVPRRQPQEVLRDGRAVVIEPADPTVRD